MTNYALTKYSIKGEYDSVLLAIEEKLETISTTIRYVDIIPRGNEFVGVLLYDNT